MKVFIVIIADNFRVMSPRVISDDLQFGFAKRVRVYDPFVNAEVVITL
jgi:hypothetical protein